MEKIFKWLYYYCLVMFVAFVVYMCVALAFAPRHDAQKRGFVMCTEKLVADLTTCGRGEIVCSLSYLWQNTTCNAGVVLDGFGAWIRGQQSTPWQNYLFAPEATEPDGDDGDKDSSVVNHMNLLKQQYQMLEQKRMQAEQQFEKELKLNTRVLQEGADTIIRETDYDAEDEQLEQHDDIQDEAFMEEIDNSSENSMTPDPVIRPSTVLQLQKITNEKLEAEGIKNEQKN